MKKIVAWAIELTDDEGNTYTSADMPDYVSQVIDDWLSTLEEKIERITCWPRWMPFALLAWNDSLSRTRTQTYSARVNQDGR